METDRPNLFSFGTGELTHDAILAWCLDWGNYKGTKLYDLSVELLELLTGQKLRVDKVDVYLEKYHIDVLALINDEIVLAIEDKIDTYVRTGQLEGYKEVIEREYSDKKRFYSYVTVGDEANYQAIRKNEYKVVERKDLLSLVKRYKKHSEILTDYYHYLLEKENDFNSYQEQLLSKWTNRGWQGFFKEKLSQRFTESGWGRVNNQQGGFQAFYWDFTEYNYQGKVPMTIYLQVEGSTTNQLKDKIAFKVEVANEPYQSEIRNDLWSHLKKLVGKEAEIRKPERFGKGLTMTYAEITNFKTKDQLNRAIDLAMKTQEQLHEILRKE